VAVDGLILNSMLNTLFSSAWDVDKVYRRIITNQDLDRDERELLTVIYNRRKFFEVEILSHLSYDLIAKDKDPKQNELRDSISQIFFLKNNYHLTYIDSPTEKEISKWKEENSLSSNINILVSVKRNWLRSDTIEILVTHNGSIKKMSIGETSSHFLKELIKKEKEGKEESRLTISTNQKNILPFICSLFQENHTHIPFKLAALTKEGQYLLPSCNDSGKFSWQVSPVEKIHNIHDIYLLDRFTRESCVSEGGAFGGVSLITAAGAGSSVSGAASGSSDDDSKMVNWVNPALKIFTLLSTTQNDLRILSAGTHDAHTAKADIESSAGFESFSANEGHFVRFVNNVMSRRCLSEDSIDVSFYGHSLGGALSQLANHTVLKDPSLRSQVSSLTLAIKNSTGVLKRISESHKELVIRNSHLRHRAFYYLVDGDGVQQTGQSNLFSDAELLKSRAIKLVMAKASAPMDIGSTGKSLVEGVASIANGFAISTLAVPAATLALSLFAGFSIASISYFGFKLLRGVGTVQTHRAKYFIDNLKGYSIRFYESSWAEDRLLISQELSKKSTICQAGLKVIDKVRTFCNHSSGREGETEVCLSLFFVPEECLTAGVASVSTALPPAIGAGSIAGAEARVSDVREGRGRCHYYI
jgi:hypothetical protein